jgi:hypothetical protein
MVTPGWINAMSLMLLPLWRRHFWNFQTRSGTLHDAAGQALNLRHSYFLLSSDNRASLALSPRREDPGQKPVLYWHPDGVRPVPQHCPAYRTNEVSVLFLIVFEYDFVSTYALTFF